MGSTALGTASGAPCRRRQRFAQRQTRISHCERPTENRIRTSAAKCQNSVILAFTTREIAHLPTGTHDPEPPLWSESDQTGQVAVLPLLANRDRSAFRNLHRLDPRQRKFDALTSGSRSRRHEPVSSAQSNIEELVAPTRVRLAPSFRHSATDLAVSPPQSPVPSSAT